MILDFRQTWFGWVIIRLIWNVEDNFNAQLIKLFGYLFGLMNPKIISKNCNALMLILNIQLIEIFIEVLMVHRFIKDFIILQSILLWYCKDQSINRLINYSLRNAVGPLERSIITCFQSLGGEHTFIKEYDPAWLWFKILNFGFNIQTPIFIFSFLLRINQLHLFYPLHFDLMDSVDLSEQGWIDPMITEMTVEQNAPLF